MKITSKALLDDLSNRTQHILRQVETNIQSLSADQLNWKPATDQWSILECLQHLNLYGEFYIPALRQAIAKGQKAQEDALFKSGWLGNYFANMMLPKDGMIVNKMKTFKDKNPANSQLPPKVLHTFISQQQTFTHLLEAARSVNLRKTRSPISISKLIRLKLGDTFRFVIYHHQRHFVQIEQILQEMKRQKQANNV